MKNNLIKRFDERIAEEITPRNQIKYLKETKSENYIDTIISIVYLYTRPKKGNQKVAIFMAEVICALGHAIRGKLKLPRNSGLAARTGAFFLYTFEEFGMLQVVKGASGNGHNQYIIQVTNDDAIVSLWNALDTESAGRLPSEQPYEPWTSAKHNTGMFMVKTQNRDVLNKLTPETHPIVFNCLNKAQSVGWRINKNIYELYKWALRNKTDAFAEIWELASPEARTTKLREAKAIGDIAQRFIGKQFYH